jgi:L-lysine 2,3-aminomutase
MVYIFLHQIHLTSCPRSRILLKTFFSKSMVKDCHVRCSYCPSRSLCFSLTRSFNNKFYSSIIQYKKDREEIIRNILE